MRYIRITMGTNLRSKGQKVKVTVNENVQIVFRAYLRQKWIDLHLRQTKTKMIKKKSCWWRGLAVTRWSRSTKLLYAGPG